MYRIINKCKIDIFDSSTSLHVAIRIYTLRWRKNILKKWTFARNKLNSRDATHCVLKDLELVVGVVTSKICKAN